MPYEITILARAVKELAKIRGDDYERIKTAVYSLAENPRPHGCKRLSGRNGWRIRLGDYRIIYEIQKRQLTILVVHIGHRREVYRQ